jgi:hypothetical protein
MAESVRRRSLIEKLERSTVDGSKIGLDRTKEEVKTDVGSASKDFGTASS